LVASRDRGDPLPAAAALFSPWTDLAATGDSIRENDRRCAMFVGSQMGSAGRLYLGVADARNPLASPLYADLSHLPPLLIHVGCDEVLLDDSRRLAKRAREAGVAVDFKIWPVVPHTWQLVNPAMPEARQSMHEASSFLRTAANSMAVQVDSMVEEAIRLPAGAARHSEVGGSPSPSPACQSTGIRI
jgi:acetyl esterase/lipase